MTEKCRICLKNTMKEECICIGHKLNEDCKILQGIITLTSIQICDKAFNQRSTLQTHMRIHSQIMPYQCTACTETYRYQHQLKSHIEKQHKTQIISENKLVI
ncbi:hypothetical protein HUJ04_003846 [Dendroctonus ponderosae]|nr:hypothetical protein HUJ04_003846 [Dendroctonus ponderosae]